MPQCDRIAGTRYRIDGRQGENALVFALDASGGRARRGVHISIPDR
ncbi:MAG: hypothetical protein OXQ31_04475 [Spirochaetaceae bacterium]|nr:hypothetical protein [Spirochaetaceae bacterium]